MQTNVGMTRQQIPTDGTALLLPNAYSKLTFKGKSLDYKQTDAQNKAKKNEVIDVINVLCGKKPTFAPNSKNYVPSFTWCAKKAETGKTTVYTKLETRPRSTAAWMWSRVMP